jgi:hypothetical protein
MTHEINETSAGGFNVHSQARTPPTTSAHPLSPSAGPAGNLIDEARAEAISDYLRSQRLTVAERIEIQLSGYAPYEFYRYERIRLKWLMRLVVRARRVHPHHITQAAGDNLVPKHPMRRGAAADVAHADKEDGIAGGHKVYFGTKLITVLIYSQWLKFKARAVWRRACSLCLI